MPLLCVASPKGGAGKTTLAANVACELARSGSRVVALDVDPQNALRLHFGLPLHDPSGLMAVLSQHGPWQAALRQSNHGVAVLPYGSVEVEVALAFSDLLRRDPTTLSRIVRDILSDNTTILIVDTPPGPSAALSSILSWTDFLVTVLLADAASVAMIPAIEQGRAYGGALGEDWQDRHGYVLNQFSPLSRLSRATGESVRRHLQDRLLGTISRDETVAEAIASQEPVASYLPASRAAQDIALVAQTLAKRLVAARPSVASSRIIPVGPQFGFGGRQS
jgi:cellulose synthase operon protein YhjQ